MSSCAALTKLSAAMASVADSSGRVDQRFLERLGFDEDTIRRDGPDAIRLTVVRETTSIGLELVFRSK